MARRLKTLAKEIMRLLEGTTAEVVKSSYPPKLENAPVDPPVKVRYGNRLIVKNAEGRVVFTHNAADPYSHNNEVERWLARQVELLTAEPHDWIDTGDGEYECRKCDGWKDRWCTNVDLSICKPKEKK